MRLLICIPAHNEQNNIGGLVARCKRLYPEAEVLVVDDGSEDFTAMDARLAGATVLTNPPGSQYRDGFQTGMRYAMQKHPDCVVFMDAGNSYRPEDIRALLDTPPVSGYAHPVIGWRIAAHQRLLTRLGITLFRLICGSPYVDYTSFRLFPWPAAFGKWWLELAARCARTAHEFNPQFAYLLHRHFGAGPDRLYVGQTEISYHPTNSNLRLWQLPGIAIRFAKFVWKENTRGS